MSPEIARMMALLPDLGAPAELWQRIEAACSPPGRYDHTLADASGALDIGVGCT